MTFQEVRYIHSNDIKAIMECAVQMALGGKLYTPTFVKMGTGVQKLLRRTQIARGSLISLGFLF
jgi:hypothetical protein